MVATRPPTIAAPSGFSGTVQYMAPEQLDGDAGRSPRRHLRLRLRALRDARGAEGVRGRQRRDGDCRDHEQRAAADRRAAVGASAARPRAEALPREGSRAALAEHRAMSTGELRWIADHPIAAPAAAAPQARPSRAGESRWRLRSSSLTAAVVAGAARPARTGSRAGPSAAALRDLHGADRRSVDGAVTGRHAARLRREPGSRAGTLGPLARRCREPRAARHRRRQLPVLVAGRPHHRVLRRRQAEADRRRRWRAAGRRRRAERPRRRVERRRRHPVRARRQRADHARRRRAAVPWRA